MAKFTDAQVVTLKGYFDAGDMPTEAQFDALIDAIQQGIEEHNHDATGDGDGMKLDWDEIWTDGVHSHGSAAEGGATLGPLDSATMAEDAWVGIGAALERLVFNGGDGAIAVMDASLGVGTLTPPQLLSLNGAGIAMAIQRTSAAIASGNVIGHISFMGTESGGGATDEYGAQIIVYADADWATNDSPGRIELRTTPAGSDVLATAVWVLGNRDVGIGASPGHRLHVEDNVGGDFVAKFVNAGGAINRHGIIVQGGHTTPATVGETYYFAANDGSGAGTGIIKTVDGVFQLLDSSDGRRKTNIRDTEVVGLDIVRKLRVRDYNWGANPKGTLMTSFVAQEAQKIFPAMVSEMHDGSLGTARAMLIPILTKAIQELDARLIQGGL